MLQTYVPEQYPIEVWFLRSVRQTSHRDGGVTAPGQHVTENYLTPEIFQNEQVTVSGATRSTNAARRMPEKHQRALTLIFALTVRIFSAKIKLETVAQGSEIACAKRERG